MNLHDEARQLKNEIMRLRPDRRRRYSQELRRSILSWVERAEASGIPRVQCVHMLGMNNVWRIASWRDREVAVAARKTGVALVRVDTPAVAVSNGAVLVTPSGYRVEGLALEQLASLLRELA